MKAPQINDLLLRWEEGDLRPEEVEELVEYLEGDAKVRREAVFHSLVSRTLSSGLSRASQDLVKESNTTRIPMTRRSRPKRKEVHMPHHGYWKRWASIAASLALLLSIYILNNSQDGGDVGNYAVQVVEAEEGVRVYRDLAWRPANLGMEIHEQDIIETNSKGKLKVRYENEKTEITLYKNARIKFLDTKYGKRIQLQKGRSYYDVAKQPKNKRMKVLTPHAEVEVVGTKFFLSVTDRSHDATDKNSREASSLSGYTTLQVEEGEVKFSRLIHKNSIAVGSGELAVIGEETEIFALRKYSSGVEWVDGPVIFKDDFSHGMDNWTVVLDNGSEAFDLKTVELAKENRYVLEIDAQIKKDELVSARIKMPMSIKQFSVEGQMKITHTKGSLVGNMDFGTVDTDFIEGSGEVSFKSNRDHRVSVGKWATFRREYVAEVNEEGTTNDIHVRHYQNGILTLEGKESCRGKDLWYLDFRAKNAKVEVADVVVRQLIRLKPIGEK